MIKTKGWETLKGVVATSTLDSFKKKINHKPLRIDRGHTVDGEYVSSPTGTEQWANYWTESIKYTYTVQTIDMSIRKEIEYHINDPVLYHADVVGTLPEFERIRPHIDTPYRFEKWQNEFETLGVQCLIPLDRFDSTSGSTGFVPHSQKHYFNIKKCYQGKYNDFFLDNVVQPEVNYGDVLLWHPRTLHSAMPNTSGQERRAILIFYCDKKIVEELKEQDNVKT